MKINLSKINLGPDAGSSAKIQEGVEKTFTENGSYTILPDEGYDAIADAKVNVNITTPVETWTDTAGMKYAYSKVSSFPSSLSFAPRSGMQCYMMFEYASELTTAPMIDTSKCTSLQEMFFGCTNLLSVPQYDLSACESIKSTFFLCSALTELPALNTSHVSSFENAFSNCSSLKNAPSLDITNGSNFASMMQNCTSIKSIQNLFATETTKSNVNISNCFQYCTSLTFGSDMLGSLVEKASNITGLFAGCTNLKSATAATIGEWTINAKSTSTMFYNCSSLVQIPCLDMTKVTISTSSMFTGCTSLQLLYKGGLKNLSTSTDLSSCTALTHDSLVDLLNVIATVNTSRTLTLGSTNLAKLTDEEKAIATGKGWTLA